MGKVSAQFSVFYATDRNVTHANIHTPLEHKDPDPAIRCNISSRVCLHSARVSLPAVPRVDTGPPRCENARAWPLSPRPAGFPVSAAPQFLETVLPEGRTAGEQPRGVHGCGAVAPHLSSGARHRGAQRRPSPPPPPRAAVTAATVVTAPRARARSRDGSGQPAPGGRSVGWGAPAAPLPAGRARQGRAGQGGPPRTASLRRRVAPGRAPRAAAAAVVVPAAGSFTLSPAGSALRSGETRGPGRAPRAGRVPLSGAA